MVIPGGGDAEVFVRVGLRAVWVVRGPGLVVRGSPPLAASGTAGLGEIALVREGREADP